MFADLDDDKKLLVIRGLESAKQKVKTLIELKEKVAFYAMDADEINPDFMIPKF